MKHVNLAGMTVAELVEHFTAIVLEQDSALRVDDDAKFTGLFWQMEAVKGELKDREGDQTRALLPLYDHPNMQVRLKAAKATLAVAPDAARRMLEGIANSGWFPQAGEAGMSLVNLDRGILKPT